MKSQRRGQEIEKADPAARRRAILVLAAGVVLGALLIVLTADSRRDLTAWAQQNPARAFDLILPVAGVSIVLPVLAMAWYFWRLGARIVREDRFPPANAAWARTTYVIRGAAARRRGRVLQICAAALAGTVLVFAGLLVRLVLDLRSTLDRQGPL